MSLKIGLRSSGLVNFGAKIFSAATGLVFGVMVARSLLPAQFGLWEFIVTIVTFSSYPVGVVGFWATRDIARGRLVGRTAFLLASLLSGGGVVIYLAFTLLTYSSVASTIVPFVLGLFLVPLGYWSAATASVMQGYRPTAIGYSLVLSEGAKLAVAYPALFIFKEGILGVIGALMAAYFVQSLVGTSLVRGASTEKLDLREGRRWFSLASLPALSSLPGVVLASDTFFVSLGFGTAIVGIYQASFLVAGVVGYSSALAVSLYPLLLRGAGRELPSITMEFSLLFLAPMAAGVVVLSQPILRLFGPSYLPGALGLSILALMFVFLTISGIIDQTLLGTERADEAKDRNFRGLARTNLGFVPMANIGYAVAYVLGMLAALKYSFAAGLPASTTIELWTSVQLVATIAFLLVKARRARRYARLLPGRNAWYYLTSAAAMGAVVYYLSNWLLVPSADTLAYAGQLVEVVAAGAAFYFGLVYVLDAKFRQNVSYVIG